MKLLVGLGNPGPKYDRTRHNAGFLIIDKLAEDHKITWEKRQFDGIVARGKIFNEDTYLLKPQTFMNISGRSVAAMLNFYKITPQDMVVLHDDVDVPSGKVKARTCGSSGGNNGIRSIIDCLGTDTFHRIKLGVGKPMGLGGTEAVPNWVLGTFSEEELKILYESMYEETKLRLRGIFLQSHPD